jgi:hypothetical protein
MNRTLSPSPYSQAHTLALALDGICRARHHQPDTWRRHRMEASRQKRHPTIVRTEALKKGNRMLKLAPMGLRR